RRFPRLSARLNHRWRTGAVDRDLAIWPIPIRLCDCRIYSRLRGREPGLDDDDDRLYEPGYRWGHGWSAVIHALKEERGSLHAFWKAVFMWRGLKRTPIASGER